MTPKQCLPRVRRPDPRSLWLAACLAALAGTAAAAGLPTAVARSWSDEAAYGADGAVEAVRQSVISSQVPGAITQLPVKAGDRVTQGQVLARVDERAADQQAAAQSAQAAAADAQLQAAQREFERSQRLFERRYISQAALEQAQAQFKAAQAETRAQVAQAGAAATRASLHTLRAPYGGILASVDVQVGDMATPGRPLMTLYDPGALRVVVTVPESIARQLRSDARVRVEVPAAGVAQAVVARSVTLLPAADPDSHTMQVRLDLPPGAAGGAPAPGMFARAWLPAHGEAGAAGLLIPARALIKRSELRAVYVVDQAGKAWLRQVRVGRSLGDEVEILAGLEAGERVALDPLAAAR